MNSINNANECLLFFYSFGSNFSVIYTLFTQSSFAQTNLENLGG
jgi:hypothetical protein